CTIGAGTGLPADAAISNGSGSFSAALKTATALTGWKITAADTALGSTIKGDTSAITVTPAAAASLSATYPQTAVAGVAQNLVVEAKDAFGNRATGYTGNVSFSSTDTGATSGNGALPAAHAFTAGGGNDNG